MNSGGKKMEQKNKKLRLAIDILVSFISFGFGSLLLWILIVDPNDVSIWRTGWFVLIALLLLFNGVYILHKLRKKISSSEVTYSNNSLAH